MTVRGLAFTHTGRVQLVPRGTWKRCRYRDNADGTATVLISAKLYTVKLDQVDPKEVLPA